MLTLAKGLVGLAVMAATAVACDGDSSGNGGNPAPNPPPEQPQPESQPQPQEPQPEQPQSPQAPTTTQPPSPAPQPTGGGQGPTAASSNFNLKVDPTVTSIQSNLVNQYCVRCHSGEHPQHGIDLTDIARFSDGTNPPGYHDKLIVPGKPQSSMFYLVMKSTDEEVQMPPPAARLPHVKPEQYQSVERWIKSLPTPPEGGSSRLNGTGP